MIKTITKNNFPTQIPRGKRIAIVIAVIYRDLACDRKSCLFSSMHCDKYDNVEFVQNIVDSIAKLNEVSCIISLCGNAPIGNKNVISLCSGNYSVAKHRYDEALKCLTFSDLLFVVSNGVVIPRTIANLFCVAQMESVEINVLNLSDA
ncbi:MAG: hypothetical protein QXT53_01025 [Ignisphaera sp.]